MSLKNLTGFMCSLLIPVLALASSWPERPDQVSNPGGEGKSPSIYTVRLDRLIIEFASSAHRNAFVARNQSLLAVRSLAKGNPKLEIDLATYKLVGIDVQGLSESQKWDLIGGEQGIVSVVDSLDAEGRFAFSGRRLHVSFRTPPSESEVTNLIQKPFADAGLKILKVERNEFSDRLYAVEVEELTLYNYASMFTVAATLSQAENVQNAWVGLTRKYK